MKKVFLGGTTANGGKWRDSLIPKLKIEYYNPVVPNWTEEDYQKELSIRKNPSYILLYAITPDSPSVYSIAEVVEDSNKNPERTVFYFDELSYPLHSHELKALQKVGKMVRDNGAFWAHTEKQLLDYLNN